MRMAGHYIRASLRALACSVEFAPMASERSSSPVGCAVAVLILAAVLGGVGWVAWAGIVRPWQMTDALFALAEARDVAGLRARIAPDRRASVPDREIQEWIDGIRGHSGWSFARQSSSFGTTRGGHSVASQRGYLHYPGSRDERHFSVSFIEFDGTWYIDAVMLGRRGVPR
jgi:hypothetical protein